MVGETIMCSKVLKIWTSWGQMGMESAGQMVNKNPIPDNSAMAKRRPEIKGWNSDLQ